jgi:hypothetical protein
MVDISEHLQNTSFRPGGQQRMAASKSSAPIGLVKKFAAQLSTPERVMGISPRGNTGGAGIALRGLLWPNDSEHERCVEAETLHQRSDRVVVFHFRDLL